MKEADRSAFGHGPQGPGATSFPSIARTVGRDVPPRMPGRARPQPLTKLRPCRIGASGGHASSVSAGRALMRCIRACRTGGRRTGIPARAPSEWRRATPSR